MKVAILGNIPDGLFIDLNYFLPREEIEIIICDNHPNGFEKIVEDFSKKNQIDYVIYKLAPYEFEDQNKQRKFFIRYKQFSFLRNDLTIYHSDYIILFKTDENPYVHYIEKLSNSLGKKIRIEYFGGKKKFSRDPE